MSRDMSMVDRFISELRSSIVRLFLQSKDIHYNIERHGENLVFDFDIPGHHIHLEGQIKERK